MNPTFDLLHAACAEADFLRPEDWNLVFVHGEEDVEFPSRAVAHNVSVDARAVRHLGWKADHTAWADTLSAARLLNYKADLDSISQELLRAGKLESAIPKRPWRQQRQSEKDKTIAYCIRDTILLPFLYPALMSRLDESSQELIEQDYRINDRGCGTDRKLAQSLIDVDEAAYFAAADSVKEVSNNDLFGTTLLDKPLQLKKWLQDRGHAIEDVTQDTLTELLEGDLTDEVRRVIDARLATTGISRAKAAGILQYACKDGRIRDQIKLAGTHTGRASGKGVQVQNFPSGYGAPPGLVDLAVEVLRDDDASAEVKYKWLQDICNGKISMIEKLGRRYNVDLYWDCEEQ